MDPLAERLRTARERQGRTLRELSAETKIREPFLEALENGRYNVLPAVYMRSFIRTAGLALHIPAKEIASLMNEVFDPDDEEESHIPASQAPPSRPPVKVTTSRKPHDSSAPFPSRPTRTPAGNAPPSRFPILNTLADKLPTAFTAILEWRPTNLKSPLVLAMAILACIALFVLVWAIFLRSSPDDASPAFPGGADSVLDVDANQALGTGGSDQGAIATTDSMLLTARASDTAWVNITSDDKRSQQVVVLPGGEYRWSAMQKFVLSVSNAGVVTFSRNGIALKPFGKNGEVVRSVTITRTDVRSSATVVKPSPKPAVTPQRPIITPAPRQSVDPTKRNQLEQIPRR